MSLFWSFFLSLLFLVACAPYREKPTVSCSTPISSADTINKEYFFVWPVTGKIVNYFGESYESVINSGLNISVKAASEIKTAAGGSVVFARYLNGWGHTVIVKHPDDFYTIYANLNVFAVKEGVSVRDGDVIGKVNDCDQKDKCIFHFEIRKGHLAQDPLRYLVADKKI